MVEEHCQTQRRKNGSEADLINKASIFKKRHRLQVRTKNNPFKSRIQEIKVGNKIVQVNQKKEHQNNSLYIILKLN